MEKIRHLHIGIPIQHNKSACSMNEHLWISEKQKLMLKKAEKQSTNFEKFSSAMHFPH